MIILQVTETELKSIISEAVREAMQQTGQASQTTKQTPVIKGIKGLSEFLKVSHSRAQALKNSGIFPHFQTGRLILFDPEKVRSAMEAYNNKTRKK